MSMRRVAATLASTATVAMLSAAPALAQIPFEPGDSYPSTRTEQPTTRSDPACLSLTNTAPSPTTIALTGVSEPAAHCPPVPSLPERRLIHADLIQSLRDDR
jgi:hypothetical protein